MRRIVYLLIVVIAAIPAYGQNWLLKDTTTGGNFINVHFWDGQNGIISGELNGKFFKTHDGGSSWDTIAVSFLNLTTDRLTDMKFIDNNYGFVCGGSGFSLYHSLLIGTKDGGQTWDSLLINQPPNAYEFEGLDFVSTGSHLNGILFTYSGLYMTLDSGKTISTVNMPATPFYVNDAVLVDNTIILAGWTGIGNNYKIYVSSDWGGNWTNVLDDTLAITALGAAGHKVYAACGGGWVIKSDNGGNSWTKMRVAANAMNFSKVKFGVNDYVYLIANNSANNSSYIYGSGNDGASWSNSYVDANNNWLVDMSMPTRDTGFAIGYRRFYRTINGGGLNLKVFDLSAENDGINLYPNPSHDKLNIEAATRVRSVAIYDITGKVVLQQTAPKQIEVAPLAKGHYLIKIETDNRSVVKKLLVE